jgi:DNA repair photolyase
MEFEDYNSGSVVDFPTPALLPADYGSTSRGFHGPVSAKMWATVSKLKSKYPDNFDWSMYDKLHEKFGDEQPRGGVVFKTSFKLANHHATCTKCHYSFELDTYGRGCIHNCTYCYAKDQLTAYGYWNRPHPFPVDLSDIRKIMAEVFESDRPSKWRSVLEQRVPLRIGSMSDSFMWMEKKYGVSKELLKILKFYKYPYVVFTRSDLIATDDYLKAIDAAIGAVQFSISGNSEELTRKMEPGAPSIERRLSALKKLASAGVWTGVRINPLFPMRPDGFFTDPDSVEKRFGSLDKAPKFELLDWSFFDQLQDAHVPSVLAGFVRLSGQAINRIGASTGVDFKTFFTDEVMKENKDKHFSDSEISYYYSRIADECTKRNIRFSTCYIGNGIKDYYGYQNLWANKSDCCDIRGNVEGFKKSSQEIPWDTRLKHAPNPAAAAKSQLLDEQQPDRSGRIASENNVLSSETI